jgi:hypothetical protein
MPKRRKITQFTCQNAEMSCTPHAENAEKLGNLRARMPKALHSTCRNAEKLRTLHAKRPKRPALHKPKMPKNYAI